MGTEDLRAIQRKMDAIRTKRLADLEGLTVQQYQEAMKSNSPQLKNGAQK